MKLNRCIIMHNSAATSEHTHTSVHKAAEMSSMMSTVLVNTDMTTIILITENDQCLQGSNHLDYVCTCMSYKDLSLLYCWIQLTANSD